MMRTFVTALLMCSFALTGCAKKEAEKKDEGDQGQKQADGKKQTNPEKPKASGSPSPIVAAGVIRPKQILQSDLLTAMGVLELLKEPLSEVPFDITTVEEVTPYLVATKDAAKMFDRPRFDEKKEAWKEEDFEDKKFGNSKKEDFEFDDKFEDEKFDPELKKEEFDPCAPHPGEEEEHEHEGDHDHDKHGHHEHAPAPPVTGGAIIKFTKPMSVEEFQKITAPADDGHIEWDDVKTTVDKEEYQGYTILTVTTKKSKEADEALKKEAFEKEFKEDEPLPEDDCNAQIGLESGFESSDGSAGLTGTVVFVQLDEQSYLIGEKAGIKLGLDNLKKDGQVSDLLNLLPKDVDFGVIATVEGREDLRKIMQQGADQQLEMVPGGEMLQGFATLPQEIISASAFLHMASASGEPMLRVTVETETKTAADKLNQGLTGLLPLGKMFLGGQLNGKDVPPEFADTAKKLNGILQAINVSQDDTLVHITLPNPGNLKALGAELKPQLELAVKQAQEAAKRNKYRNNLKEVLLAMHNYHDFQSAFFLNKDSGVPEYFEEAGNYKISWRAHIAEMLWGGGNLNPNLKEGWQSDANKALISKMPETYQTLGIEAENKTGWRVFSGPKAPIQPGKTIGLRDFTDGASNTILVIQVGPDKAVDWTDPTPLKFDPENPAANKAALGNLPGKTFLVGFADGSVQAFPTSISPELLTKFLTIDGGEEITPEEREMNGLPADRFDFDEKEDLKFDDREFDGKEDFPSEEKEPLPLPEKDEEKVETP